MTSLKVIRAFQIFIGVIALSVAIALALSPGGRPGAQFVLAIVPLLVAMLPIVVIEAQLRGMRAEGVVLKGNLNACANELFDSPAEVRPGYDMTATASGPLGQLAMLDQKTGAFTADGRYRDASVSVASHISTIGRQFGELHHTYSHVVVDVLGLDRTFRISKERVLPTLGKAVGAVNDVDVGDAAFDKMFVVNSDSGLAKDVLEDETIRQRLMQLQSEVSKVSQVIGQMGGMNVQLTKRGLALRWPGGLDTARAKVIRDLLLDMRDRILAHENRKAVRVGTDAAGGYRVATEPLDVEDEVIADEANRRA